MIDGNGHNGNGNGNPSPNGNGRGRFRDKSGRFVVGNPGGPGGNNLQAAAERLRHALCEACTKEDVAKVANVLIKNAMAGKPWAIDQLFNRLFGKPRQQVDVSGLPEPIKHLAGIAEDEV